MAVEAPAHGQWFNLSDDFHLGNIAMATGASDSRRQMSAVIEIGVVGEFVHANPLDRLTGGPAFSHREQFLALGKNQFMAVHTGLRRRNIGVCRKFDIVVTITAVDSKIAGMQFMAVGNRLYGPVSDIRIFRRAKPPEEKDDAGHEKSHCCRDIRRSFIGPFGKYLCQCLKPCLAFARGDDSEFHNPDSVSLVGEKRHFHVNLLSVSPVNT